MRGGVGGPQAQRTCCGWLPGTAARLRAARTGDIEAEARSAYHGLDCGRAIDGGACSGRRGLSAAPPRETRRRRLEELPPSTPSNAKAPSRARVRMEAMGPAIDMLCRRGHAKGSERQSREGPRVALSSTRERMLGRCFEWALARIGLQSHPPGFQASRPTSLASQRCPAVRWAGLAPPMAANCLSRTPALPLSAAAFRVWTVS